MPTLTLNNLDFQIDPDNDVVNGTDFIPEGESNPHRVKPWLMVDGGIVIAVAMADCEQDALDEAFDAGKLDAFKVTADELKDYETGKDDEGNPEYGGLSHLGNHGTECDIETLEVVAVPPSKWTYEYWTQEQLDNAVNDLYESLPSLKDCNRIDTDCKRLADLLKESVKR